MEKKKETLKEKLENLFDGDDRNSNNIFDRISHQMTSPRVDSRIDELMKETEEASEKPKKGDEA